MEVDMLLVIVLMRMAMNIDVAVSGNCPDAYEHQKPADCKLGPARPGVDIDQAAQKQPDASNSHHTETVAQTPVGACPRCLRPALERDWRQRSKVINAGEDMEAASSESGQN